MIIIVLLQLQGKSRELFATFSWNSGTIQPDPPGLATGCLLPGTTREAGSCPPEDASSTWNVLIAGEG